MVTILKEGVQILSIKFGKLALNWQKFTSWVIVWPIWTNLGHFWGKMNTFFLIFGQIIIFLGTLFLQKLRVFVDLRIFWPIWVFFGVKCFFSLSFVQIIIFWGHFLGHFIPKNWVFRRFGHFYWLLLWPIYDIPVTTVHCVLWFYYLTANVHAYYVHNTVCKNWWRYKSRAFSFCITTPV